MANIAATQSSNSDEWATPFWLIDLIKEKFHIPYFDLDAAATAENKKATEYYDIDMDGLALPWKGYTFCNPPYSQIAKWVAKGYSEAAKGNADVTLLVASRTDTRWWWDYIRHGEVYFIKGRIKFIDPVKGVVTSAPFPSAVVHFTKGIRWSGIFYWDIPKEIRADE